MTVELIDRTKHFVRNARMCRCGWEGDDVTTHISDLLLAGVKDLVEPLIDALDDELIHEVAHSDRVSEAYNKVAAMLGRTVEGVTDPGGHDADDVIGKDDFGEPNADGSSPPCPRYGWLYAQPDRCSGCGWRRVKPEEMDDECCVKHCEQPAIYGLTMVIEGLRVELYACEPHFDILSGGRVSPDE